MDLFVLLFFGSFLFSLVFLYFWQDLARRFGIVGIDLQKANKPEIPESGGVVFLFSFFFFLLIFVGWHYFLIGDLSLATFQRIVAVFSSILIIGLIGFFDDIFDLGQLRKVLLSFLAAIPLMSLKISNPLSFPFLGEVYLGSFYFLFLIPIGIIGASNAFDMVAGYNGVESGMMVIISTALAMIALKTGDYFLFSLLLIFLGTSLALFLYNRYPSKIFVGDVGTMIAGAFFAIVVILGNIELAGLLLFLPYFFDFFLKVRYKLPKTFGVLKNGKLYTPEGKARGLGQLIMKIAGGIEEKKLTLIILLIELVIGFFTVILYWFVF